MQTIQKRAPHLRGKLCQQRAIGVVQLVYHIPAVVVLQEKLRTVSLYPPRFSITGAIKHFLYALTTPDLGHTYRPPASLSCRYLFRLLAFSAKTTRSDNGWRPTTLLA